jgi:predicted transcriptional regulator
MNMKVDAMDEHLLLVLREGPQGLQSLTALAGINYNTLRQRIDKLSRYNYIAKPGYGKYSLTDKGKHFVDELSSPVAPDFNDPGLKKLIDMLPSELHRAFFRLVICGVIAKYLLFEVYDDGYPGFIIGGRTKGFKTALAKVVCRVFGLSPDKNIYPLYVATPGEFGVRRFRSKGAKGFDISESPYFNESFMVFDEFDKVSDKNIKQNVLFFLDGRSKFNVEEKTVQNHACCMVTLNTNLQKESLDRFGIPEPYIRRCVVADTEYVETELRNVDLVAKEIFELKDFPRISLKRLQIKRAKLTDGEFNSLRNLLLACVNDEFQRLVDTRPLVILALGRSALLAGDLQESIYQTLWDRLICLESLGVCVTGWRELVRSEWNNYKQKAQPEIKKQLVEAEAKEQERKSVLEERKVEIQQRSTEQTGARFDLLYRRQCLVKDIKSYIPRFQRNHPEIAKTMAALWREAVAKATTEEALKTYRETFENFLNQKVFPVIREEKRQQSLEAEKREQISEIDSLISKVNTLNKRYKEFGITNTELGDWFTKLMANRKKVEAGHALTMDDYILPVIISIGMPRIETTLAEIKKKKEEEKKQRNIELGKLKARLKGISYYLRRKRFDAEAKEDPIVILQQLKVISPTGFYLGPVQGSWESNGLDGKTEYKPPIRDFVDMGGKPHSHSEIKMWLNWQAIYPLLQMAHEPLQAAVNRLESKT